jgi:hypothetical protein
MNLDQLRTIARRMGVTIEEDHQWCRGGPPLMEGSWLINEETGEGVWEDDNFCTNLDEVLRKLQSLAAERGLTWGKTWTRLTDLPLTSWDTSQALEVVWAALERLDLPEDEQDQLNTAMAWIEEGLDAPS